MITILDYHCPVATGYETVSIVDLVPGSKPALRSAAVSVTTYDCPLIIDMDQGLAIQNGTWP